MNTAIKKTGFGILIGILLITGMHFVSAFVAPSNPTGGTNVEVPVNTNSFDPQFKNGWLGLSWLHVSNNARIIYLDQGSNPGVDYTNPVHVCVYGSPGSNPDNQRIILCPPPSLTLSLIGNDYNMGITSSPAGIGCTQTITPCEAIFPVGTNLTFTATSVANSQFLVWSICDTLTAFNICVTTSDSSDETITVYSIPWSDPSPIFRVVVTPSDENVNVGDPVTLTAIITGTTTGPITYNWRCNTGEAPVTNTSNTHVCTYNTFIPGIPGLRHPSVVAERGGLQMFDDTQNPIAVAP